MTAPTPETGYENQPLRPLPEGRYTEFSPVAEGGMGVVFLALDTDLHRQVAMKVVRAGSSPTGTKTPLDVPAPESGDAEGTAAFGELRARFLREAMVTGMMEHPGVIPVYELGQTSAGVPYYTMRFVKGRRTLRTAIDEARTPEDRLALLEPFLKVCDAIAYAHARGILHRDLKPENVAIGEFGEVIVLDWGLAKITGRGGAAPTPDTANRTVFRLKRVSSGTKTVEGVLGTPGYMSPEAAAGDLDHVDERSDVHSLGVLLFEILTGRLPFDPSDLMLWLELVVRKDPPRARSVEPSVPAGLDALCAEALRRDRLERIESAKELAARLRAWQRASAGEREREARLVEAETALKAAEGLVGAALLRQLDRAGAAAARVQEIAPDEPRVADLVARTDALRERGLRERESATRRKILRRVAIAVLAVGAGAGFLVAKTIDEKRDAAETAKALMRTERDRADAERRRADAEAADAKVQSAHAEAQRAIADAQRRLALAAEAKAVEAEASAKASLERAETVLNFLVFRVAGALRPLGRLDDLETVAAKALEYFDQVPPAALSPESLRQKSVALDILGDVQLERGDHAGALATYRRALEIARSMSAAQPASPRLRHDVTVDLSKLGNALHALERDDESLAAFEEAVAILHRLVEEHPDDEDTDAHRRSLAETQASRATALAAKERVAEAEKALEEALSTARRLLASAPTSRPARSLLASMLDARGSFERGRKDLAAAAAAYEESSRIRGEVVSEDATDMNARHAWSVSLGNHGEILEEFGRLDEARAAYEAWLGAAERVIDADETNVSWVRSLILAHEHLARVLDAKDLAADALPHRRVAFAVWKAFLAQKPDDATRERGAIDAGDAYDAALLAAGATEDALAVQREVLDLVERGAERAGGSPERRREASVVHNRIGRALRALDRPDEAAAAHRASLAIISALAASDPSNAGYAADEAYTEWRLGEALTEVPARVSEGRRLLEKAASTLRALRKAGTLDESAVPWIEGIEKALAAPRAPSRPTPR